MDDEDGGEEAKKSKRRGKSAPDKKPTNPGDVVRDNSPPDPLEPWSTKDLANINKLLDTDEN